jgi:hypothetical protein
MKKIILVMYVSTSIFSSSLYASRLTNLVHLVAKIESMQGQMLAANNQMLGIDQELLRSQKDINNLMKQVNAHLTSHSGWGTYQFHDHQSYGGRANDWSGVMHMAEHGNGDGQLGKEVGGLSKQFPADRDAYNGSIKSTNQQKYYALKSQTVLAARATSTLDYNKIQEQIAYQHMLQQQIEKTQDLKAAVDLQNRIQVEGNLINLQILRQASIANQQQAVTDQASINSALANARFLTKN